MRILIVDDHAVLREGARRLLGTLPGAEIFEAANAADAFAAFRKHNPAIIVLDICLNDSSGLELLPRFRAEQKSARVVVFTTHAEPSYALRALRAGACGYVTKAAPASELIAAVSQAAAGRRYVDRTLASELAFAAEETADPIKSLSNRELEILRLLGEGKSLMQIASTFGIAYKTVVNSCSRVREKLGVERTVDLIRVSIESRNRPAV